MAWKLPPNFLKKAIIAFVVSIFAVQIVSLGINQFFPSVPLFKGGTIVLVMLLCVAVISLFVLAINLEELKRKENLIFIVIVFALLIAGYYFLPKYLPQIFSIDPTFTNSIKSSIASIFGVG